MEASENFQGGPQIDLNGFKIRQNKQFTPWTTITYLLKNQGFYCLEKSTYKVLYIVVISIPGNLNNFNCKTPWAKI